jgi:SAM-dependent methyltransferase
MDLTDLQQHWDHFGREDPLWAILTLPGKENRQWNLIDFFQTGVDEIFSVLDYVGHRGLQPGRGAALDFGCGVGRLTQALCSHFDRVWGVDIAPSMIANARTFNRFSERCIYQVNARDDLGIFEDGSFDFVYSNITLQHMPARFSLRYIQEFLRVLAPNGAALFQLPAGQNSQLVAAQVGRTIAAGPLPAGAFKAEISVKTSPITVRAGSRVSIETRVGNTGSACWPSSGQPGGVYWLHLGDHWLDGSGKVIAFDDARVSLPHDVAPGETAPMTIEPFAPNQPGDYLLELDMVQEGVAWFKDRGSCSIRVPVHVTENAVAAKAEAVVPRMEMHCVPSEKIVRLVEDSAGEVVDTVEDGWAGPEWRSVRYLVRKK